MFVYGALECFLLLMLILSQLREYSDVVGLTLEATANVSPT